MKTNNEYHNNGSLAYTENIVTISESDYNTGKYPNCRISPDGTYWIRTGLNAKYYDNGVMAWGLHYDEFGNVDKNKTYPSKRKDETIIQY